MRVLFLMSDTGGGHRSAAQAIADALTRLDASAQVRMVDFLAGGSFPLPLLVPGYGVVIRYPPAWRFFWYSSRRRVFRPLVSGRGSLLVRRSLRLALAANRPDIVVSVHPLATSALDAALHRLGLNIPNVVVVTDMVTIHPAWAAPKAAAMVAPTAQARDALVGYGVPPERVSVLGLPVDLRFAAGGEDRRELRRRLGLDPDRFTLLMVSGGEGTGGLDRMCGVAAKAAPGAQLVVVTGRNEATRRRLMARRWPTPVHVLGFVRNMHELMQAADLLVTKAGPGTISEALACGLPMVISSALPGQEEGNVSYVVENGAGYSAGPKTLGAVLQRLASPEGNAEIAKMTEAARRIARPEAANDIARLILDTAAQARPPLV